MTTKTEFNAEEWSRVTQAPALAGIMVVTAERGGTIRESISLAQSYGEARQEVSGAELVDELLASPPSVDPREFRSTEELRSGALARLREAVSTLEQKASAEEVDAYRRLVLSLAQHVAESHKEGGFIGIGGKPVSDGERRALAEIAEAVGTEARA